ncbi:UNVERIFIED_CONTAM: hypothetical protein HDU68_006538, partial [Siphonaria sp. JEL0065]
MELLLIQEPRLPQMSNRSVLEIPLKVQSLLQAAIRTAIVIMAKSVTDRMLVFVRSGLEPVLPRPIVVARLQAIWLVVLVILVLLNQNALFPKIASAGQTLIITHARLFQEKGTTEIAGRLCVLKRS